MLITGMESVTKAENLCAAAISVEKMSIINSITIVLVDNGNKFETCSESAQICVYLSKLKYIVKQHTQTK
jgi:hypothetical protein